MQLSCPNCQHTIENAEAPSLEMIRCPDCGVTIRLEPEKTGPWASVGEGQPGPAEIGQAISHYRLGDRLGSGGMGVVYRAHDTRLDRPVALKFLPQALAQDPRALERFQREARTASALNHPHICTIHQIDEYQGQPFLVMELIEGRTLRALLGQRPAPSTLAQWIGQAARALAVAHAASIVHRDIKPENLMVRGDGVVKVLDFGLARRLPTGLTSAPSGETSEAGLILGTLRYMSPEQARGETASSASDIFALGIVLYELAVGQHPFPAASPVGVLNAIIGEPPLPPARLNPEIPAPLEGLLLRMLEKDPRLRPSAAEVDAALAELARSTEAPHAGAERRSIQRHTVGRQAELAELRAGFASAAAGRGLFLCVAGEPGIGKTTLVEEFLDELAAGDRTCRVARGRCSERLAGKYSVNPCAG